MSADLNGLLEQTLEVERELCKLKEGVMGAIGRTPFMDMCDRNGWNPDDAFLLYDRNVDLEPIMGKIHHDDGTEVTLFDGILGGEDDLEGGQVYWDVNAILAPANSMYKQLLEEHNERD